MQLVNSVALIGPICAGKTTLSQLLGKFFNCPVIHTDLDKSSYFLEKGFNEEYSNNILKEKGLEAYYDYLKIFEYDYMNNELVLPLHPCIYDIGAGLVCYEEELKKSGIIKLLDKFNSVILILPHRDYAKSYQLIHKRLIKRSKEDKELFRYVMDKNFDLIKYALKKFNDLSHDIKLKEVYTYYPIKISLSRIIKLLLEDGIVNSEL